MSTVQENINSYYRQKGKERATKKKINIEKYIKDYEEKKITVKKISTLENVSITTVHQRINEYYEKNGTKRRHKTDIEKYIKDYEEGKITIKEIANQENVCERTIMRRIDEYYSEKGIEKLEIRKQSRRLNINIEKYIKDYEEGKITKKEIANQENVCESTIKRRIDEYYSEKGIERPDFRKRIINSSKIDITKHIDEYERGEITVKDIAKVENVSSSTIFKLLQEYYSNQGKNRPKFNVPISVLRDFLKRGMSEDAIREVALRRNIIIKDEDFELAKKTLNFVHLKDNEYDENNEKNGNNEKEEKNADNSREVKHIDIEQYINDYENGKITIKQISQIEGMSASGVYKNIKQYYQSQGKVPPKIGVSITILQDYLKKGMTREQIRDTAKNINVIITDKDFEMAEEILKQKNENEDQLTK